MGRDGRRSFGSTGDAGNSDPDSSSKEDGKAKVTTIVRLLTVMAYIIGVSTGAALLSAYYIFLWVPQPSDPLPRPTESPFSLAQHGSSGSFYHYPKNSYSFDTSSKHLPPSRNKKSHYHKTTLPPNLLPRPQYLVRQKATQSTTTTSPRTRF